jgi:hypothetical protein
LYFESSLVRSVVKEGFFVRVFGCRVDRYPESPVGYDETFAAWGSIGLDNVCIAQHQ